MKTLLGIGPIHIQKQIGEDITRAVYNGFLKHDYKILLDIVNQNKYNKNGEDMSWTRGLWMIFDLILLDPPLAYNGYDGESHIKFFEILNDYIAADREDQWFEIVPANCDDAFIPFRCKFHDPTILLKEASQFKGKGQIISLKIKTKDRLDLFPITYAIEDPDEINLLNSII